MRTSLKWIKDLVPGIEDLTPQEYLDAMTLSGSKGEYYVELDKNLENIVIGQILKIEKHPPSCIRSLPLSCHLLLPNCK